MATSENHRTVVLTRISVSIVITVGLISGPITSVKRLKKNKLAFGFNKLVRSPILVAVYHFI